MKRQYFNNDKKSQFNLVFEQFMHDSGLDCIRDSNLIIETNLYTGKSLNFILEDIAQPLSVTTTHGDVILLEDVVELSNEYLITEGILDAVKEKFGGIINKIASGLKEVLSKGWEAVKSFIQKVMNIEIIKKISDRCEINSIVTKERLRKCFIIKTKNDTVSESVILEATKLSKKEEALTDPQEIQKYIDKYQKYLNGESELKNKKSEPLSKKYAKTRLDLFQNKLKSLDSNGSSSESSMTDDSAENAKADETKKKTPNVKVGAKEELLSETVEAMKSEAMQKLDEANSAIKEEVPEAKEDHTEEAPKEEKKGFFSKLGKIVDKGANWVKDKAKKAWNSISSEWVKALLKIALIVLIIWVLGSIVITAISAVAAAFTAGGFFTGASAAIGSGFALFYGGKKIKATVQAGQKAWESGTGWSDFFIQLASTVLSIMGFASIAMLVSNSKAIASKAMG